MKDKKILYLIIIAFVFLLSIGLTYAYFSVTTDVVGDRNDIKASVGTLSILYTDGPEINAEKIQPGWAQNKTISVENTGTLKAFYALDWASYTNQITNGELTFHGGCSSNKGTCDSIPVSEVNDSELVYGIRIDPGEKHTYIIRFTFIETGSNQNYNQGKSFNGVLNVVEASETYALSGTLMDQNENPIVGATIEVHSVVRSGITNQYGQFTIKGILFGDHEVIVKNSSNVSIVTDTISLLKGEKLSINNNQITVDEEKETANVEITLGEPNIDNIALSWYDACENTSNDIKCKILNDNTEYADNRSSPFVSSGYGIVFNNIASNTNGKGLYYSTNLSETEKYKRVYYFRGAVTNNYLIYGGYCWRIVRTVEDGSVRLRYGGVPTEGSCPQTGTDTVVTSTKYNTTTDDNAYVGYMYGTPGSSTYSDTHANTNSSNIKKVIDAWYSGTSVSGSDCYDGTSYGLCDFTGITNKLISNSSLIADTPYCNDRSIGPGGTLTGTVYTELGYGTNKTIYSALRRLYTNGPDGTYFGTSYVKPTYKCNQDNDKFTVSNTVGNGALTYPIALLTYDEAIYAGYLSGNGYEGDPAFLTLATNQYYLMTPTYKGNYSDYVSAINSSSGNIGYRATEFFGGVVPAISLKSSATVTNGTGAYNNPYIVE